MLLVFNESVDSGAFGSIPAWAKVRLRDELRTCANVSLVRIFAIAATTSALVYGFEVEDVEVSLECSLVLECDVTRSSRGTACERSLGGKVVVGYNMMAVKGGGVSALHPVQGYKSGKGLRRCLRKFSRVICPEDASRTI
jgi:hypothetical protein